MTRFDDKTMLESDYWDLEIREEQSPDYRPRDGEMFRVLGKSKVVVVAHVNRITGVLRSWTAHNVTFTAESDATSASVFTGDPSHG